MLPRLTVANCDDLPPGICPCLIPGRRIVQPTPRGRDQESGPRAPRRRVGLGSNRHTLNRGSAARHRPRRGTKAWTGLVSVRKCRQLMAVLAGRLRHAYRNAFRMGEGSIVAGHAALAMKRGEKDARRFPNSYVRPSTHGWRSAPGAVGPARADTSLARHRTACACDRSGRRRNRHGGTGSYWAPDAGDGRKEDGIRPENAGVGQLRRQHLERGPGRTGGPESFHLSGQYASDVTARRRTACRRDRPLVRL